MGKIRQNTFTVTSSHGTITACCYTGQVLEVEADTSWRAVSFVHGTRVPQTPEVEEDCYLLQIDRFDLEEWHRTYPGENIRDAGSVDILDLGFWTKDGAYDGPVEDWRQELKLLREEKEV